MMKPDSKKQFRPETYQRGKIRHAYRVMMKNWEVCCRRIAVDEYYAQLLPDQKVEKG